MDAPAPLPTLAYSTPASEAAARLEHPPGALRLEVGAASRWLTLLAVTSLILLACAAAAAVVMMTFGVRGRRVRPDMVVAMVCVVVFLGLMVLLALRELRTLAPTVLTASLVGLTVEETTKQVLRRREWSLQHIEDLVIKGNVLSVRLFGGRREPLLIGHGRRELRRVAGELRAGLELPPSDFRGSR